MKKVNAVVAKEKRKLKEGPELVEPRFEPSPIDLARFADVPTIVSRPGTPEDEWVVKWRQPGKT